MSLSNRSTSANAPLLPQSRSSTQSSILHPPSPPSMQQHTHGRLADDWQTNKVQRPSFYGGVGSNTKPVPITINVYDLHPYNRYLHWLGMGVYHSGVQVFGSEYTYGLHPYACTGVFETPVKHATGAVYRCSHIVGHCTLTKTEFAVLMEYMKSQFLGCDYHLLLKNCNHFADALCEALGVQCPSYVNRLAKIGWRLRWCLPQWMLQINVPTEDSESYDGADPYNLSSIDSPTIHPRASDDRNFSSDDYIRYAAVQSPRHRKQSKDYDKLGNTTLSSRRLSAAFTLEGHASPSHKLQQEGRSSTPHADDAAAVEQRQRSADDHKSHGHSSSTSQLSQRSNGTSSDDSPMLTLDTTISDRDIDLLGFADRAIPNDKALLHSPFASPQKPHKKYAKHASDSFA